MRRDATSGACTFDSGREEPIPEPYRGSKRSGVSHALSCSHLPLARETTDFSSMSGVPSLREGERARGVGTLSLLILLHATWDVAD